MFFSKAWSYAVRALVHLAEHSEDGPILSATIAECEGIPAPFLVKILGTLGTAGMVEATRGRNGGFILKVHPDEITLLDITNLFERSDTTGDCILGYGACSDVHTCPIHDLWVEPRRRIEDFLQKTTLTQLCCLVPEEERRQLLQASTADRND